MSALTIYDFALFRSTRVEEILKSDILTSSFEPPESAQASDLRYAGNKYAIPINANHRLHAAFAMQLQWPNNASEGGIINHLDPSCSALQALFPQHAEIQLDPFLTPSLDGTSSSHPY